MIKVELLKIMQTNKIIEQANKLPINMAIND